MNSAQLHTTLQLYDAAHDTASLDLAGEGSIDAWLDGIHIDPSIARAFMAGQIPAFVHFHDEWRFDNAVVLGIIPPTAVASTNKTQQGRAVLVTNNIGTASTTVSFAPAFSASPQLTVALDNTLTPTLSGISATGFTVSISGLTPNTQIGFSWSATGT